MARDVEVKKRLWRSYIRMGEVTIEVCWHTFDINEVKNLSCVNITRTVIHGKGYW